MVRCKLVHIINKEYCYETDVYHSVIGNFTDWDEVSDEDFDLIKKYIRDYEPTYIIIVEENKETVNSFIKNAKQKIKEKEEAALKRKEIAEKREKTRLANIKKKELKLLSELEKKYEKVRSK